MEFQCRYKLSDGQERQEKGVLKQVGDKSIIAVTGSYTFMGPDGKTYRVTYSADENGYHAKVGGLEETLGDILIIELIH